MIRNNTILLALFCVSISVLSIIPLGSANAHHGFAVHYDVATQVHIEGTIEAIQYRNPHSIIKIRVASGNASDVIWTCETQAKSLLVRKGITADRFPVGQSIVVDGSKARREAHGCEIGQMRLPDGDVVTVRSIEGRANIAVNTVTPVERPASIFGHWVRDSFSGAPVNPGFMNNISDQGRVANLGYDGKTDDPTRDCRPANPVRAMFAPGTPSEIHREDDRIVIRHEFMDTTRIVFLEQPNTGTNNLSDPHPKSTPGEMGFSTGRIEDGKLIVTTNNFTAGVLLTHVEDSGVLHSEQMTLREVFSVNDDDGQLVYQWEAIDPLYFTAPIDGQLSLSRPR